MGIQSQKSPNLEHIGMLKPREWLLHVQLDLVRAGRVMLSTADEQIEQGMLYVLLVGWLLQGG